MTVDLRFGFSEENLVRLKDVLEGALGVRFSERESSFYGGTYFRFKNESLGEIIIQRNYDAIEDEWIEDSLTHLQLLLNVSDTKQSEAIKAALGKVDGCELIHERAR